MLQKGSPTLGWCCNLCSSLKYLGFFVVVFVLGFLFVYFSMCWPRHGQSSKELILSFYHGILRPNLGPQGCTASKFTSWAISQAPTVFVLMEKRKVKSDITNSISVQLHAACVMFVFLLECYTVKSQLEASKRGLSSLPAESAHDGSWVLFSQKGTCKMILKRTRDSSTGFLGGLERVLEQMAN